MLKDELYKHCHSYLQKKLKEFKTRSNALVEALHSESKSSAGDKHETGRAMIQLEREKLGVQLAKAEADFTKLVRLKKKSSSKQITTGTLVITNKNHYYIAIAAEKCTIDNNDYYCISPQSPLGIALLGKKVGDCIAVNHNQFTITAIL